MFQRGSLIFQLILQDEDPNFINAVKDSAISNARQIDPNIIDVPILNHVGLVVDNQSVIEASSTKGVCLTNISEFLSHGKTNILAYMKDLTSVQSAIDYAYSQIGKPYNPTFEPDADGLYCSQLISNAYPKAFKTHPMTFGVDEDHDILPFWTEYYLALKSEIPLFELGSHPSSLIIQDEAFSTIKIID